MNDVDYFDHYFARIFWLYKTGCWSIGIAGAFATGSAIGCWWIS